MPMRDETLLNDRTRPPSNSEDMYAVTLLPLDEAKQKISFLYNIPIEFLYEMTEEQLAPYLIGLDQRELVASTTVIYKVIENYDGTFTQIASTYEAFLQEQKLLKYMPRFESMSSNRDSNSWIEITTTLVSVSAIRGEVSGAFRWLTPTPGRFTDSVGLTINNGTTVQNSANGFHRVDNRRIPFFATWTANTITHGHGYVRRAFNLPYAESSAERDFVHLRFQFYRNGLTSTSGRAIYTNQRFFVLSNPILQLTRTAVRFIVPVQFEFSYRHFDVLASHRW